MRRAAPLLLAALLAAIGAGALLPPGEGAAPRPGRGATFFLAASSLAHDLDLEYGEADRERFAALWGHPPADVEVVDREGVERLAAPAVPAALAAPWVRLAPRHGLPLAGALALALAAGAAWIALSRRLEPAAAAGLLFVAIAGSIAFHAPFRSDPASLVTALAVAGLAVAALGGPRSRARVADVYDGPELGRGGAGAARHLAAGALVGLAVSADLSLCPLLVAAALPRGVEGRGRARAAVAAGIGALGSLAAVAALAGPPWEAPRPVADGALFLWNLAYAGAGRHTALLAAFLPAVALLGTLGREPGRLVLPAAVAASLLARLALQPFDWAGAVAGPAQLGLLPLFGALWLVPARPLRPVAGAALLALSGLFLWPLWLAPRAGEPAEATARGPVAALLARLPVETSLRQLPGATDREQAGVAVRALAPAIRPAATGELELAAPGRGVLLIASPRRLTGLRLAFDEAAPSGLEVRGAELGNTIFRPAGGVEFDLLLDRPRARHASPWGSGEALFYPLTIRFERPPPEPLVLRVAAVRAAVPEASDE